MKYIKTRTEYLNEQNVEKIYNFEGYFHLKDIEDENKFKINLQNNTGGNEFKIEIDDIKISDDKYKDESVKNVEINGILKTNKTRNEDELTDILMVSISKNVETLTKKNLQVFGLKITEIKN